MIRSYVSGGIVVSSLMTICGFKINDSVSQLLEELMKVLGNPLAYHGTAGSNNPLQLSLANLSDSIDNLSHLMSNKKKATNIVNEFKKNVSRNFLRNIVPSPLMEKRNNLKRCFAKDILLSARLKRMLIMHIFWIIGLSFF